MTTDRPRHLLFEECRRQLQHIAFRVLGSRGDAQDVVQEAYLRWHAMQGPEPANAPAWLRTVTLRLCIDRLRQRKARDELLADLWLIETLLDKYVGSDPEEAVERAGESRAAVQLLLERLSPDERAALLLHDVFGLDHAELAALLGRSQAACRQLLHRARTRARDADRAPHRTPDGTAGEKPDRATLEQFVEAIRSADHRAALAVLQRAGATLAKSAADGSVTGHAPRGQLRSLVGRIRLAGVVITAVPLPASAMRAGWVHSHGSTELLSGYY